MKLRNPLKNSARDDAYAAMYELFLHDNFAGANKAGEKLLKEFPDDEKTLLLLGQIGLMKKQRARAREWYNKAVEKHDSTTARLGRADASFGMKKRESALEDYLHLYESSRKNFPYMTKLGATYAALQLPHIALRYFQKAVTLMPNDLEARFALIGHLVKLKHYKEADEQTQQTKEYYYTHKSSLPPQTMERIADREKAVKPYLRGSKNK